MSSSPRLLPREIYHFERSQTVPGAPPLQLAQVAFDKNEDAGQSSCCFRSAKTLSRSYVSLSTPRITAGTFGVKVAATNPVGN